MLQEYNTDIHNILIYNIILIYIYWYIIYWYTYWYIYWYIIYYRYTNTEVFPGPLTPTHTETWLQASVVIKSRIWLVNLPTLGSTRLSLYQLKQAITTDEILTTTTALMTHQPLQPSQFSGFTGHFTHRQKNSYSHLHKMAATAKGGDYGYWHIPCWHPQICRD